MLRTQLIDELKLLRKRHRNDKYATFETRWIDVLDAVIGELEEPRWHTGTPTEGGLYFVYEKYVGYAKRDLPTNISKKDLEDSFYNVIAWQKIELYKETDNG